MNIGFGGCAVGGWVLAMAGVFALGIAAPAQAEPPPGEPPSITEPPSSGVAGLPDPSALQNELLLGQTAAPALPGTDPGTVPNPRALNNAYLLPQNVTPSAPGEGQIVGVAPGEENADVGQWDYLHRLWQTYQQGGLAGGLLGQAPG